jgi:hypothetical protein
MFFIPNKYNNFATKDERQQHVDISEGITEHNAIPSYYLLLCMVDDERYASCA